MANRIADAVRVLIGGRDALSDPYLDVPWLGGERRRDPDHRAEACLDYMACELAKARPIASLPVHVYEHEGGERVRSNHRVARDLDRLMRGKWNPFCTASAGLRWLVITADTLGTAHVRAEWDRRTGRLVHLWPVTASMEPGVNEFGDAVWTTSGDALTPAGTYLEHEVVTLTSSVPKRWGAEGRSLADVAMAAVGLSIDLEQFYTRLLTEGNHFPGWLETDEALSAADKRELADTLRAGGGIVNSGQARLFPKGVHYHQVPLTMAEMDLTRQQAWVLERICAVCGVPPTEVGDLTHSTYSNTEQQAIQFASKTLVPVIHDIEAAFQPVLDYARLEDTYVRFSLEGLLRGTYAERMEGYRVGISAGFFVRNEVRAWEDLPALPGLDAPLQPVNFYAIGPEGEAVVPGSEPATPALAPVYADMEGRVAERFARTGDTQSTRDFAAKVLKPWAEACLLAGVAYDMAADIDRLAETPVEPEEVTE